VGRNCVCECTTKTVSLEQTVVRGPDPARPRTLTARYALHSACGVCRQPAVPPNAALGAGRASPSAGAPRRQPHLSAPLPTPMGIRIPRSGAGAPVRPCCLRALPSRSSCATPEPSRLLPSRAAPRLPESSFRLRKSARPQTADPLPPSASPKKRFHKLMWRISPGRAPPRPSRWTGLAGIWSS
jgi:hypothetical protein